MDKPSKKLWFLFEDVCFRLRSNGWKWQYGKNHRCFQRERETGKDEIFVDIALEEVGYGEKIIIRPNYWSEEENENG